MFHVKRRRAMWEQSWELDRSAAPDISNGQSATSRGPAPHSPVCTTPASSATTQGRSTLDVMDDGGAGEGTVLVQAA